MTFRSGIPREVVEEEPMSEDKSAKQYIRELWRDVIEDAETIDMKAEAERIAKELKGNPDFCSKFVEGFIGDAVWSVGQNVLRSMRNDIVRIGAQVATADSLKRDVRAEVRSRFADYFAHDPKTNARIALPEMTKEQLLRTGRSRIGRGEHEVREGEWMLLIAGRLNPGQKVGDVWTDDELDDIRTRLNVTFEVGLKPVTVAAAAD